MRLTDKQLDRMARAVLAEANRAFEDAPQIEPEPMTQHERLARQRLRHTRYPFCIIAAQWVVIAGLVWRVWK